MLKKLLIGVVIFLFLLTGFGAYVFYKVRTTMRQWSARSVEEQKLLQPRIVTGEKDFQRRLFYTNNQLGHISQIEIGWPADHKESALVIVGSHGADFLDPTGLVRKQIRLSIEQNCPIAIAHINASGGYGYLTRDQSWACPVTLFDEGGHPIWHFNSALSGIDDSASGDLYGNGTLSVIVGLNGDDGITLLNGEGKTLWNK